MRELLPAGTLVRPDGTRAGTSTGTEYITRCVSQFGALYIVHQYEADDGWYICRPLAYPCDPDEYPVFFPREIEEAPTDE